MPESDIDQQETATNPFLEKLQPADILAAIVIIGGLILMGMHINGIVGGLLVAVVAYYFGKKENRSSGGN